MNGENENDQEIKRQLIEHESRVSQARAIETFVMALETLCQRFDRGLARMDRWLQSLAGLTVLLLVGAAFLALSLWLLLK